MSNISYKLLFKDDYIAVYRLYKPHHTEERLQPIVVVRPTNVTYIYDGITTHFYNIMNPLNFFIMNKDRVGDIMRKARSTEDIYYFDDKKALKQVKQALTKKGVDFDGYFDDFFDGEYDDFEDMKANLVASFVLHDEDCSVLDGVFYGIKAEEIKQYFVSIVGQLTALFEDIAEEGKR